MIFNNYKWFDFCCTRVVNYFQNLYLCDFQQLSIDRPKEICSCELLSKFVSLWFPTTSNILVIGRVVLWITFKICTFVISNNIPLTQVQTSALWITFKICIFVTPNNLQQVRIYALQVVNYFQNLYLCDFQQHGRFTLMTALGCELLSKFVSLWLPTTTQKR